jgi:hypothetical protein
MVEEPGRMRDGLMTDDPDRIRDGIAATRSDLVRNVDALADRTMPNRIARRRWEGMKDKMHTMSEKVMGAPRSAASSVGDVASRGERRAEEVAGQAAQAARELPHAVAQQAQGNPVAAGIIAFGVGLLAASLMPTTNLERQAVRQLKESGSDLIEPMRQPMAESAQRIKEDVKESVSDAAQSVKQTAQEAAQNTADDAKNQAKQVTDRP